VNLNLLEALARQRGEELCREAEFRERHRQERAGGVVGARQPSRVRRRMGFLLLGAGNRLLMEPGAAS
jgi:hypothetical protein